MKQTSKKKSLARIAVGAALRTEQLRGLAAELQQVRNHPPLVRKAGGKYEGDILGFVKGLRLSVRVAYFLREQLSHTNSDVNWGHLLDDQERSFSPECDVIIHKRGHIRKWNGHEHPIMDFAFVRVANVQAVVSCKSTLNAIDKLYPKTLLKFGVKNVLLFAECCAESQVVRLQQAAKDAGYKGMWCLYLTKADGSFHRIDEAMHLHFANTLTKIIK